MKELLNLYQNKAPEIVFNWKDPETEAEGWTVINSLRGGAAGGGARMRWEVVTFDDEAKAPISYFKPSLAATG